MTTQFADPDAKPAQDGAGQEPAQGDAQAADEQQATGEQDWKSRYSDLEHRFKSLEGNHRKQSDFEALIQSQGDALEGLTKLVGKLAEGIASGETSNLPGEVAQIEAERKAKASQSRVSTRIAALREEVLASLKGEDGKDIIPANDPELSPLAQQWEEAGKAGDIAEMAVVASRVGALARKRERQMLRTKAEEDARQAREAGKKTLKDAKVDDLSVGGGSAAGGRRQYTRADLAAMTPQEYATKARKDMLDLK